MCECHFSAVCVCERGSLKTTWTQLGKRRQDAGVGVTVVLIFRMSSPHLLRPFVRCFGIGIGPGG